MSEHQFREDAWRSVTRRVIDELKRQSSGWSEGGPSALAVNWAIGVISRMPVPHPAGETPAQ